MFTPTLSFTIIHRSTSSNVKKQSLISGLLNNPQVELQGRARVERQPGRRVAEDLAEHSNLALGGGVWSDEHLPEQTPHTIH